MISTEKPGTPEELVHFGVKGMKWGVRRSRGTRDFKARHRTSRERTAEIKRARANVSKAKARYKAEERGSSARKAAKDVYLKHPDRATALRLTRGQKAALILLAPAGPIGVGLGAGVATRVGRRRALED